MYEKKIAFYDKLFKSFLVFATLLILIGVAIGVRQVFVVGHKIDTNIINNNNAAIEARKQNMQRQENITNYVKCILLLSKKHPELNIASLNYDQSNALLDECATKE